MKDKKHKNETRSLQMMVEEKKMNRIRLSRKWSFIQRALCFGQRKAMTYSTKDVKMTWCILMQQEAL